MKKLLVSLLLAAVLMMSMMGGAMAAEPLVFTASPSPAVFYLGSDENVTFTIGDTGYSWDQSYTFIKVSFDLSSVDTNVILPSFLNPNNPNNNSDSSSLFSYDSTHSDSKSLSSDIGSFIVGDTSNKTTLTLSSVWLNENFLTENVGTYPLHVQYTDAVGDAYPILVIATPTPAPNNGSGSSGSVVVPLVTASPSPSPLPVPSTGDSSQAGLWAALGLAGVAGLTVCLMALRRKKA